MKIYIYLTKSIKVIVLTMVIKGEQLSYDFTYKIFIKLSKYYHQNL